MDHTLKGEYKRVFLTPLSLADSELLLILRNKNREWFFCKKEISREKQAEWYRAYLNRTDDFMFSIHHKKSGVWIGAAALYRVDRMRRLAEFGRLVVDGKRVHEKGLGLDATVCLCNLGFETLGLSKITLEVYQNNIPALKTYAKAGFTVVASDCNRISMELNKL